ncbi:MAG: hypothetical protein LC116_06085, partial [Bacteroidetes bacterium]|nr:hypothetical protein [Bacteroidota bacterium]
MKTVRLAIGSALLALLAGTAAAQDMKTEKLMLDNGKPVHNYVQMKASPLSTTTYTLIWPVGITTPGNLLRVASVSGNDLTLDWHDPASTSWSVTGNGGLIDGTNNLLGTTDNTPVRLITNGIQRIRLLNGPNGGVLLNSNGGVSQQLQFQNPAGTFITSFQAGAQASDISYTLPLTLPGIGTTGLLKSNDAGTLSWESISNFEVPLTFNNGITRTGNIVKLGGLLTDPTTTVNLNGNNLSVTGTGNVAITQFT